jgi:serine/threonine-protein kinase
MAEVYRAEQALTGGIVRPVALKVIRPEYSESTDFLEMFLDEARTACTLSHPNIVHIYEVGEVEGLVFMAMELVSGEALSVVTDALRARGERFSDEALLAVGIATCAALEAVHARPNLVHRDVSPQNLLLSAGGSLKLIDFGIAQAATNRNLTRAGTTKGKAGYFSPEQAKGKPLDGRSDLFSLGVTLYALAAGAGPLDGYASLIASNTALVRGEWEPLSRVCPELPRGLLSVVEQAMRLKPEERFPDARAMREALEAVALEAGLPVGPSSLAGYVHDEGEEVSVSKTLPRRTRGAGSGVQSAVTASQVAHRPTGGRKLWAPVAGIAVALALSVVGAAVLLPKRQPAPVEQPVPVLPVAEVPAAPPVVVEAPAPEPVPEPPAAQVVEPEPEVRPEPPSAPVVVAPPASPVRPGRPKREPKRVRERARAVVAPAPEEEVLVGNGSLRIGATAGIQGRVKLPGRALEELPLIVPSWKAGRYTLRFLTSEGEASCEVKVPPERRTLVVFDGSRCAVSHRD